MTIRWRRLLRVPDVMIPLGMAAAIGAVYLSALFLWGVDGDGATAAGNRFLALPPDNVIPTLFADRLETGASPKHLLGGWLSSDRPPLQTGLILAVRSPLRLTGLAPADVAFAAGVAFQLLWIPALWGLCRRLGGTERLTAVVILATSVSETTLLHSVYTWPKLAAAAFVLGAWTLLLERGARWLPATASLAALAYLSHGGAIFPLLAAVPAAVPVLRTARTKTVLAAVGCLAALALPWVAYQRFYEPPGDRLLKWHLAGVVPIDSRSFPDALVDQYGEIGIAGTVKNKVENVQFLAKGSFIPLFVPVVASSAERRHDEFHYLLRGLAFGLARWLCIFSQLVVAVATSEPPHCGSGERCSCGSS